MTDPVGAEEKMVSDLIEELRSSTCCSDQNATDLLASVLPLLHRVGPKSLDAFLEEIGNATNSINVTLNPGTGSPARRALLQALSEEPSVYFWLGHCAYATPDPDLLLLWSAEAERTGPSGKAAPWDTAGLCTENTLGRNITPTEAKQIVEKYSLSTQGAEAPPHRRYLSEVLACSFGQPDDYRQGNPPVRWYPGWQMSPPREGSGGSKAQPPHHTFEVRRAGKVPLISGLLGIVASDATLARNRKATRNLEKWARSHAVWECGQRLHRANTGRGETVAQKALLLVEQFLREEAAI